jgi:hypothetical protein
MMTSERISDIEYTLKRLGSIGWDSDINAYVEHLHLELKVLKQVEAKEMEIWKVDKQDFSKMSDKLCDLILDGVIELCHVGTMKGDDIIEIYPKDREHLRRWLKTLDVRMCQ